MKLRRVCPATWVPWLGLALAPLIAAEGRTAHQALSDAKAAAVTIPGQAEALVRLAWPTDGPRDPAVQAAAREELVAFGSHGMTALRTAIQRVAPEQRADVTAALIQAMRNVTTGIPPDYLLALEDAIWFGSVEARRLAISEIARFRPPGFANVAIDAATTYPELRKVTLRALKLSKDPRARFFLGDVLAGGTPAEREMAAAALAAIGGEALGVLREATRSSTRDVRQLAARSLAPLATLDDLTVLHEYVGLHPDDDPTVRALVLERAMFLESLLEGLPTETGASPPPDH